MPSQCSWDNENNLQDGLKTVLGQNEFVATCNTACHEKGGPFCPTVVLEASRVGHYNNIHHKLCHTINAEGSISLISLAVLHHCGK